MRTEGWYIVALVRLRGIHGGASFCASLLNSAGTDKERERRFVTGNRQATALVL